MLTGASYTAVAPWPIKLDLRRSLVEALGGGRRHGNLLCSHLARTLKGDRLRPAAVFISGENGLDVGYLYPSGIYSPDSFEPRKRRRPRICSVVPSQAPSPKGVYARSKPESLPVELDDLQPRGGSQRNHHVRNVEDK